MNVYFHKLFDGISVVNGLGSGVLYILPENLDECLEIFRKGRQKGLDYRQVRLSAPTVDRVYRPHF